MRRGFDVRRVARNQRLVLWLVLANIAVLVLYNLPQSRFFNSGLMPMSPLDWVVLVLLLLVIVGTILLMRSLKTNIVMILIGTLLLLLPVIGLIVLLLEIRRAAIVLRKLGLPAGFWGIADVDVVRACAPNLCLHCEYDLTGNVSGICPECGTPNPARKVTVA